MALALAPALQDLHVGHASFSAENVHLNAYLHLIFAVNKDLLDLQPFIKYLVLATFPRCYCIYLLKIVMMLLSQLVMKLKLVL